jgi:hypothetical protein
MPGAKEFLSKKILSEALQRIDGADEIGEFWVVTKPKIYWKDRGDFSKGRDKIESSLTDICFKSSILHMANQVRGGLDDVGGQIYGFYKSEAKAKQVANKLLNSKDEDDFYYER